MEVLLHWPCRLCCQPPQDALCPSCLGKGYIERWVPYTVLVDIKALFKHAYVIVGRCHTTSLSALTKRH